MKNKILKIMICGLCLITIVGCGKKEDNNTQNNGENNTQVDFINDNKSYFVSIDGKKYYAGDAIASLNEVGYHLREREQNEEVPANKYMIGAGYMQNDANKTVFHLTPFNTKDSAVKITDAIIGGFTLSESYAKSDERSANFEVYGGLKLGSTMEEVKSVFGEPSDTTEGSTYIVYRYESSEVYRNYKFTFDKENKVKDISWQNLVFNR